MSDHWKRQLIGKRFDAISFRNGYAANAPLMIIEWKGMKVGSWQGEKVFVIKLGKILERRNLEKLGLTQRSLFDAGGSIV